MKQATTIAATALALLAISLSFNINAAAQTATPVPKLDLNQFMAPWYEIEHYPIKAQKHCVSDERMLYAFGDKRNTFQIVTSCLIKDGNSDSWNSRGKLDKGGSGAMKVNRIWPLTAKYWVLATGPAYVWALIGSPNHKSLWVLSKSKTLSPDVLAAIQAQASAQGFNSAKLVKTPQPN